MKHSLILQGESLVGSCRVTDPDAWLGRAPRSRVVAFGRQRQRQGPDEVGWHKAPKETRRAIPIDLKRWRRAQELLGRPVANRGRLSSRKLTAQAPAAIAAATCSVLPLCLRVGPWRRREATPVAVAVVGSRAGLELLRSCATAPTAAMQSSVSRSCRCILLASHRLLGHWKTPCATRLVNWTSDYRRPHQSFSLRPVHFPCRSGRLLGRGSINKYLNRDPIPPYL